MSKGEPKVPGALRKGLKKISDRTEKTLDNLPQVCYTIITGEANPTNAERVDTMEKMTYVQALTFAIDHLDEAITASGCADWDEEARQVIEKLTALKAQTEKRNSADRKPTAKQIANADLAERVVAVLSVTSDPLTVTEIMARDEALSALSNQKVSALIRLLGARVVKTVDKRVSKFSLA